MMTKEQREKHRERARKYYWAHPEKERLRKRKGYKGHSANTREEILRRERQADKQGKENYRNKVIRITDGIESYIANMVKYYTKEHRLRRQKQLKKDFEQLQQHLQVA